MKRSDMVEQLSKGTGLTKRKAEEIVKMVFSDMVDALARGDRVEIRGFGRFTAKNYNGYAGHNPKTGEIVKVNQRNYRFLNCGKELKERVDIQ